MSTSTLEAQVLTPADTVSIVADAIEVALAERSSAGVTSVDPVLCLAAPWLSGSADLIEAVAARTGFVARDAEGCVLESGPIEEGAWVDRETGNRALRVQAGQLKQTEDRTVSLDVGFTAVGEHARFYACEAKREMGRWRVACSSQLIH